MKVLIVDDEELHAKVIADYLSLTGIVSNTLYSGNRAIDWLQQNDCDIVVTDIKMLDGTGIDLMKWILEDRKELPVIAMSGGAEHETEQFCEIMGIPFLPKPLNFQELRALVYRFGKQHYKQLF